VVDRDGAPVDRALISLAPGGVEMITDSEGRFMIDYMRDEAGERAKLGKKTEYTIEAFRTGYHIESARVYFKKGELIIEPITLTPDTVRVAASEENLDPASYEQSTQATGAAYEGE